MSAKIKGFIVSLKQDASEEYAEKIASALQFLSCVAKVEPIEMCPLEDSIIRMRVEMEMKEKLWKALE